VLQNVAVWCALATLTGTMLPVVHCVALCCIVLQYVELYCSVLHSVALCCSVCCNVLPHVLQCVVVWSDLAASRQ